MTGLNSCAHHKECAKTNTRYKIHRHAQRLSCWAAGVYNSSQHRYRVQSQHTGWCSLYIHIGSAQLKIWWMCCILSWIDNQLSACEQPLRGGSISFSPSQPVSLSWKESDPSFSFWRRRAQGYTDWQVSVCDILFMKEERPFCLSLSLPHTFRPLSVSLSGRGGQSQDSLHLCLNWSTAKYHQRKDAVKGLWVCVSVLTIWPPGYFLSLCCLSLIFSLSVSFSFCVSLSLTHTHRKGNCILSCSDNQIALNLRKKFTEFWGKWIKGIISDNRTRETSSFVEFQTFQPRPRWFNSFSLQKTYFHLATVLLWSLHLQTFLSFSHSFSIPCILDPQPLNDASRNAQTFT